MPGSYLNEKSESGDMGRGKLFAVLSLFLIVAGGAAANGDTRTIQVGGQDTITASVSNPLDVPDSLRVEVDGQAVRNGIVVVTLPGEDTNVTCHREEDACEVSLDAGGEQDVAFTVRGEQEGSGDVMVTVSSETTGKRAEASIHVTVESDTDGGFMAFLNRLLGIT